MTTFDRRRSEVARPSPAPAGEPSPGRRAAVVAGSLLAGLAAAVALVAGPLAGSREAVITGGLLLGFAAGQRYPASITFGLPCPTVFFTFGVFCLLGRAISPVVYVIPVAWAVIGSVAAAQLGITQDFALPVAAAAALLLALPSRAVTRLKEAV